MWDEYFSPTQDQIKRYFSPLAFDSDENVQWIGKPKILNFFMTFWSFGLFVLISMFIGIIFTDYINGRFNTDKLIVLSIMLSVLFLVLFPIIANISRGILYAVTDKKILIAWRGFKVKSDWVHHSYSYDLVVFVRVWIFIFADIGICQFTLFGSDRWDRMQWSKSTAYHTNASKVKKSELPRAIEYFKSNSKTSKEFLCNKAGPVAFLDRFYGIENPRAVGALIIKNWLSAHGSDHVLRI